MALIIWSSMLSVGCAWDFGFVEAHDRRGRLGIFCFLGQLIGGRVARGTRKSVRALVFELG